MERGEPHTRGVVRFLLLENNRGVRNASVPRDPRSTGNMMAFRYRGRGFRVSWNGVMNFIVFLGTKNL